jgi:GAF domain-containing protein
MNTRSGSLAESDTAMVERVLSQADLPASHAALLQRTATEVARTAEPLAFVRATLAELQTLLAVAWAEVWLVSRDGDELAPMIGAHGSEALPLHALPALRTALDGGVAMLPSAVIGSVLHDPPGRLLVVPLIVQGRPIGALMLGPARSRALAAHDVMLAELVASLLTGAIYLGWLAEGMTRRNEELAMVADIAAHVSSSLEIRAVYRLVMQKLREYFRVEAGSLLRRDEATEDLVFVMTLEGGEEKLAGARVAQGVGIAGYVAATQQPYISNDVQNDQLHYGRIERQVHFTCRSMLCVPLVVKGTTLGVIELINKLDGPFTEDDARRLAAVTDIIGVAIENAQLFEFVVQRRNRLEALVDQLVARGLKNDQALALLERELRAQDTLLVTKFTNPYIVGQPVLKPEMCFGREPLFKRMMSVLHRNSVLLYGERRIGKTTMLKQLEMRLHAADDPETRFRPVFIDLQGVEEGAFFTTMIEEILHRFGKRTAGLTLQYQPGRGTYGGREFQRDLRTLVTALCGEQPDGRIERLVLLIDEADVMYGYDERALQEFRRIFMNDYAEYLSVVFAAVDIHRQWRRYESPLYNLFHHIEITPLTRDDIEALARSPVRGRYEYDDAAIELIVRYSAGRPMKAQLYCMEAISHVREQGRTTVLADDIERANEVIRVQGIWPAHEV